MLGFLSNWRRRDPSATVVTTESVENSTPYTSEDDLTDYELMLESEWGTYRKSRLPSNYFDHEEARNWKEPERSETGPPIVVFDVDGTIADGTWAEWATIRPGLREFMRALKLLGYEIHVWTRGSWSHARSTVNAFGLQDLVHKCHEKPRWNLRVKDGETTFSRISPEGAIEVLGRLPALSVDNWSMERIEGVPFLKVDSWEGPNVGFVDDDWAPSDMSLSELWGDDDEDTAWNEPLILSQAQRDYIDGLDIEDPDFDLDVALENLRNIGLNEEEQSDLDKLRDLDNAGEAA